MRVGLLVRALVLLLILPAVFCGAADNRPRPLLARSGNKKLLLFAKNPATWAIIKGGANGRLSYRESTGAFTLTAAGLNPRSSYALVRYADAPPGAEILAKGVSDERGRLGLTGAWRNWTKKFWLVSGEDVAGSVGEAGTLRAWRPDRYLFEEKPLGVACACPDPEEPE